MSCLDRKMTQFPLLALVLISAAAQAGCACWQKKHPHKHLKALGFGGEFGGMWCNIYSYSTQLEGNMKGGGEKKEKYQRNYCIVCAKHMLIIFPISTAGYIVNKQKYLRNESQRIPGRNQNEMPWYATETNSCKRCCLLPTGISPADCSVVFSNMFWKPHIPYG